MRSAGSDLNLLVLPFELLGPSLVTGRPAPPLPGSSFKHPTAYIGRSDLPLSSLSQPPPNSFNSVLIISTLDVLKHLSKLRFQDRQNFTKLAADVICKL